MADVEDTPETRWPVVRLFLILTPVSFALCFVLATLQGAAEKHALLIGGVAAAGCLLCAAAYHLLGPASKKLLYVASAVLGLIAYMLRH